MSILQDRTWRHKYSSDDGNLLELFYVPALSCAVRYDRTTGFFSSDVLAAASTGVENLIRNGGHMRLIVGCTLQQQDIEAIGHGEDIRDVLDRNMNRAFDPLLTKCFSELKKNALELLAWMVARGILEIRVAVPCDRNRKPMAATELFHEKAGIIEDRTGDRLAFNGSVNETCGGWGRNWESFHVYTSWDTSKVHLDAEEKTFTALWNNESRYSMVLELGEAVRRELLRFMPSGSGLPARLCAEETSDPDPQEPDDLTDFSDPDGQMSEIHDERAETWKRIRTGPGQDGGGTGAATSAVVPWPHQIHAFRRMYDNWPPRLLIADEVGLGKTVQAGLLLRQAWMSGRAGRILVLAPKPVVHQWQIELREKFNLNWPVYEDRKLVWYPSPALKGHNEIPVEDSAWHRQPFLLASSHLMRRRDRREQILNDAEPWDIIVLDEAHHARRKGGIGADTSKTTPNDLLRLMQGINERKKTKGLVLLTATPMQVHPLEVWDLLRLLGLPQAWTQQAFLDFYSIASEVAPDADMLSRMAQLCRACMETFGEPDRELIDHITGDGIRSHKILSAIRFPGRTKLQKLSFEEKRLAVSLMKTMSPTKMLISRHTRELLRKYHDEGKLSSSIAVRRVEDVFIALEGPERELYEAVQDYISTTYDMASQEKRTAVGFVMTIYRRRLASCFESLRRTLAGRLERIPECPAGLSDEDLDDVDDLTDLPDLAEGDGDACTTDTTEDLRREEREVILGLLDRIGQLPVDSKVQALMRLVRQIRQDGYTQVIIFTQFTDTLDYLRDVMAREFDVKRILCYSGRQGEIFSSGTWTTISREKTKRLFREGQAHILICTDAAAEGLNFQFCGVIINYDMPWNPMRVEQRIGRIDRLGQAYPEIRIYNLLYRDTVETDIYLALQERIHLFTTFVGRLQPILSKLPGRMKDILLARSDRQEEKRNLFIRELEADIADSDAQSFDIDEVSSSGLDTAEQLQASYDLRFLQSVIENGNLRPPDVDVRKLGQDYSYIMPGADGSIRVTTDAAYYEEHADSVELWSPGSPAFPWEERPGSV